MAGRAIDRLKKAANLKPSKRSIVLADGSEFEFFAKPLTMAEREKAQKDAKTDDVNQYALHLLIAKACDENGSRLFSPGDIADLKNATRDEDVQGMMLAMLAPGEEEEPLDMKSSRKGD
jgi:hypothetical protein